MIRDEVLGKMRAILWMAEVLEKEGLDIAKMKQKVYQARKAQVGSELYFYGDISKHLQWENYAVGNAIPTLPTVWTVNKAVYGKKDGGWFEHDLWTVLKSNKSPDDIAVCKALVNDFTRNTKYYDEILPGPENLTEKAKYIFLIGLCEDGEVRFNELLATILAQGQDFPANVFSFGYHRYKLGHRDMVVNINRDYLIAVLAVLALSIEYEDLKARRIAEYILTGLCQFAIDDLFPPICGYLVTAIQKTFSIDVWKDNTGM